MLGKFEVSEMADFADQAIPNTTPVAFTEFDKKTIGEELGSRDIPLVLNSAPSVYASSDSGGAGDARINVRGFSQRNTAILINGVPTNDMENGWLYWSNWDGLGDVTRSIQFQRGLSNTSLPLPGIGGVLNIITDPAASSMGGSLKLEAGSNSFYKATVVLNTGKLQDKFAMTAGYVTKEGDGAYNYGWTKGQGYYLGAAWFVNDRNRLEFYAISAPQQHGQRYDSNIAVYSIAEAKKLGYTDDQIKAVQGVPAAKFYGSGPLDAGFDFNPNAAPINPSYSGRQYYWGTTHARNDANYLNETVNYFNKPQMNLNWFSEFSDSLKLAAVLYYSGGRGGGSGTYGSIGYYTDKDSPYFESRDFQSTIVKNMNRTPDASGEHQAYGILRNSVNNQDTYGAVAKLTYTPSTGLSFTTGADWRTATLNHYREVRDLLGADYYLETSKSSISDFWTTDERKRRLGDKINYWNTNTVDWISLFLTAKYSHEALTAFATYGYSIVDYTFTDHFHKNAAGGENYVDSGNLNGQQIKGGVNYKFTKSLSAYVNAGWVSKTPIFDGAIDDTAGVKVPDPENEKFTSYEAGVRWDADNRKVYVAANVYHTIWKNRTEASVSETADLVTYQRGINTKNEGFELEGAYKPNHWVRFDVSASFGNWTYTDDVAYQQYRLSTREPVPTTGKLYIAGLKIGDQPQTAFAYAATVYPTKGLSVRLEGFWYDRYYADYNALTRNNPADRGQAWEIPSYQVYNLHINYRLPARFGPFEPSLFAHVFNLFDKTYISDATDNSSYEGLPIGYYGVQSHTPQTASVFFGQKINYNVGVKLSF
jgi:outer membrane receptor for ferrienterochelin and colicin